MFYGTQCRVKVNQHCQISRLNVVYFKSYYLDTHPSHRSLWHARSKGLLQQNPPALNWGCRLVQAVPYYFCTTQNIFSRNLWTNRSQAPFTRYILLSNRLSNPFDNRLYRVYSRLSNRLYNPVWQRLNEQWLFVQHGCQNGLTNGCIV